MADKQSMILYYDWAEDFAEMTDEEVGKLINAILKYEMTGEDTKFEDRSLRSMFRHMKKQSDINRTKYEEISKKNSENAKRRWSQNNATACDRTKSHKVAFSKNAKNADKDSVSVKDNDNDPDSECVKDAPEGDTHTREAVRSFFQEQNFISDPDKFYDYNIGRGNEKIFKYKNRWQATARIWEKNEKDMHPPDEFDLAAWAKGG